MNYFSWAVLIKPFKKAWGYMLDRRVPIWLKLIPIIAIIYVLSPLDIIPDVIVGFGQLDDIGIIIIALQLFLKLTSNRVSIGQVTEGKTSKSEKTDWKDDMVVEDGEFEEI